jgi:thioredoxin 1
MLIEKNAVDSLLEDADQEQLEILLNNFSPAETAFEVEVLNATMPVILYFYNLTDKNHGQIQAMLEKIAMGYKDKIKVVTIDAQALYKIVEKVGIEELPTIMAIKDRQEIEQLIEPITEDKLKELIERLSHL